MNTHDMPGPLSMEPEDLDGHTIEELSDYLDSGRSPADPSIDESAGCQIALDALERLRALTPELFVSDTAAEPEADETWVQSILAGIALDARAGRRIPIVIDLPGSDAGITEGAVRGVIRAAENTFPGVLIGRCRFEGDVTVPGEPILVRVDVSVAYGLPILDLVDLLRAEIATRLRAHTTLNVTGIDITVSDLRQPSSRTGEER
jgi:uncharacterized alkaline shock family protein YloU